MPLYTGLLTNSEEKHNTIDQKEEWPFVTCQAKAISGNAYYSNTSFYM